MIPVKRVLIVKTSSLGDLIHTLPAVSDAAHALQGVEFHWLVEEALREVPAWHPAVSRVIPIALRRWRRNWWRAWRTRELAGFRQSMLREPYDLVIDGQGLLKSALPARFAGAPVSGYDHRSIREPLATFFYHQRYRVERQLHAIERLRRLFSLALGYALPDTPPEYGLEAGKAGRNRELIFLHGTTWPSKHWPEKYWIELARLALEQGYQVRWPWHAEEERRRAERFAQAGGGELLPRMGLTALRGRLTEAAGAVGVDTGLAHVAAAVGVPAVTLYGPTGAGLTGAIGPAQKNLVADYPCAPCLRRRCDRPDDLDLYPPCYALLSPEVVWQALAAQMDAQP